MALWPRFVNESCYTNGYWVENSRELLAILVILDGDAFLTCSNRKHLLKKGSAAIIPYGHRKLETGPAGYCIKRAIGLQGLALKVLLKTFHLDSLCVISAFHSEKFELLFKRFCILLKEHVPETIPEISELSYSLLLELHSMKEQLTPSDALILAQRFMEQHLSRKIMLEELCSTAGCGVQTLETLFKKHTGLPPMKFLKKLRIDYAKGLLENESIRIKETARLCGYANQLYFSNDFRRQTGLSPGNFRVRFRQGSVQKKNPD